jgi:hypothetical protein
MVISIKRKRKRKKEKKIGDVNFIDRKKTFQTPLIFEGESPQTIKWPSVG